MKWKAIPGWQGYEVSDAGVVRSIPRVVEHAKGPTARAGKVLRQSLERGKYARVYLQNQGRKRTAKVHHLVLEAFVGPCPAGLEARHLNGASLDNRVRNLTWGTRSENVADRLQHGGYGYHQITVWSDWMLAAITEGAVTA